MSTWNDPDTNQRAFNLICTLRNQKFITGLVMLENITASLKPLTVYLQRKDNDLGKVLDVCKVVIDDLRNMKEDSYWIKIYEEIQLLCQKLSLNLTIPRIGSRRMITELFNDSDNPSDYYKIIFHTSLNNVINDLKKNKNVFLFCAV